MLRRFKEPSLDAAYRAALCDPPTRFQEHKGCCYRRTGSGRSFPFWVGYDHPDQRCPYGRNTPAYAVWAAGIDYRRLGGRDYPKNNHS